MRRKMVVANRKMNGDIPSNQAFLEKLVTDTRAHQHADYVVCMPHPYLYQAQAILKGSHVHLGGQNMSRYQSGAHTGSVSPPMLKEFGCEYVIIGHSERRLHGHDTDTSTGERFEVAINSGLIPIFCMGETLDEYEDGATDIVTIRQLNAVIHEIGVKGLAGGVLAYEPVWAIGTGKAATPEHAQNVLSFLRGHIELLDAEVASNIRILYGGSVNSMNAKQLFSMPDIDGALVGTASLNTEEFIAICVAASDAS
jgi:triosephosphate isomerase (TIM)